MAEAVETQEVKEEKKGGSNIILIVIVSLLFVLVIGGAAMAYFMLKSDSEVIDEANKATSNMQAKQINSSSSSKSQRVTNYAKIGPMYPMDQFIVNLYNEGSSRYLKTTINFELSLPELSSEMDTKKPLIRDIVIKTLSAKTYEEISTIRGKENLKDEIVSKVNQVLTDGKVNNIFFTDFVIQ
ncbi:MAG: flagellar basal body protein FliL [Sulfurospirillum sp.]|nr:MAG: flagellar basal body protein FliL [Sulfurospirillum sp.]